MANKKKVPSAVKEQEKPVAVAVEPRKAIARPAYEPVKAVKKVFVMSSIEDIESYAAAAKKNKLAAAKD